MAKMSRLQQAYDNPNMRRFLNAIADAEGVKYGYNTLFGNQQFGDLSQHPNIKKAFKQTDGKTNYTTAAGRYQFIIDTWNGLAKQYGFKDFSPRNQDLGAIALIAQSGALDDVLMGRYQKAAGKLGGQWASLPSSNYAQPKRSWDQFNKYLGGSNSVPVQTKPSQNEQPLIKRTPMMGNWAEFTKNSQSQERAPFEAGNWSQFTSQNPSNEQVQQRTPMMGNWAEFTQLSKGV